MKKFLIKVVYLLFKYTLISNEVILLKLLFLLKLFAYIQVRARISYLLRMTVPWSSKAKQQTNNLHIFGFKIQDKIFYRKKLKELVHYRCQ